MKYRPGHQIVARNRSPHSLSLFHFDFENGEGREREREREEGSGRWRRGRTRRRYEEEGELVFSSHLCFALAFVVVAIWYFDFD